MEIKKLLPLLLFATLAVAVVGGIATWSAERPVEQGDAPLQLAVTPDKGGSETVGRSTPQSEDNTVSLLVWNSAAESICELYVYPDTGDEEWGPNLISGSVIMHGDRVSFDVEPGTYKSQAKSCMEVLLAEERGVVIDHDYHWMLCYAPEAAEPEGLQLEE
jgi:hypothetical protein